MILSKRSKRNLEGVSPDLVRVVHRAAALIDAAFPDLGFIVTSGMRTPAEQAELVRIGASRTMKSQHLIGRAVDLAAVAKGEVRWDWPLYYRLADVMKQAAKEENVEIEWGGDWEDWKDGPHFQLSDRKLRGQFHA